MLLRRTARALPPALLTAGCRLGLQRDGSVEVDGVRLTEHHRETLALEAWPAERLSIEARAGDVVIARTDGPTTLEVRVRGRAPGAAHARVRHGRLESQAVNGPCAIGDVTVHTALAAEGRTVSTGLGAVRLHGVRVEGEARLATGMGDVRLEDVEGPLGDCSTGMGDIELVRCTLRRARGGTGLGDIDVRESHLTERDLSCGLGSVRVR